MRKLAIAVAATGLLGVVGTNIASAADRSHSGYHDGLDHRDFHRELDHRDAHRYPMTWRQHERLHDSLEHDAYHDRLEHRDYHRSRSYYGRRRGFGFGGPDFSFWSRR